MGKYNVDCLAVKENNEDDKITGVITAEDILKYYSLQKQKEHMFESPATYGGEIWCTEKNSYGRKRGNYYSSYKL